MTADFAEDAMLCEAARRAPFPTREHLLRAALVYARRGWRVVDLHGVAGHYVCACRAGASCTAPGKHPRSLESEATSDEHEIRRRWSRGDVAPNVGIATGYASRLVVLDVDPIAGGDISLVAAAADRGGLPRTLEIRTGGGGRHYYFAADEVAALEALGRGLKWRAGGGYVVAAPSTHASGGVYGWANRAAVAPLPAWAAAREVRARHT